MRIFSNNQIIILIFLVVSVFILLKSKGKNTDGFDALSKDTLTEDGTLIPGSGLTSKNGKYRLDYGLDGKMTVIQLEIDASGNVPTDDGSLTVNTIWDAKIKSPTNDSIIEFKGGNVSVVDDKDDVLWSANTKVGSRLVINDDGALTIYDNDDNVIWSSVVSEGMAIGDPINTFTQEYKAKITDVRNDIKTKKYELAQLQDHTQNNYVILTNLTLTVLASSMIYYIIAV